MKEKNLIAETEGGPVTRTSLKRDFEELGIRKGMTLIVHSSLSSLGWVCGGAQAVIQALEDVLTESGTLVMPTHTGDLSDPANWVNPPVPPAWWDTIRREMPPFSREITPTRGMGKIPETFRKQKGVRRSGHPQLSFAAWGKNKEYITQDMKYEFAMDEKSPLGRIYEMDGYILLLGVTYSSNTSMHLAEYKAVYKSKSIIKNGMPVEKDGKTSWREFDDIEYSDNDVFDEIGRAFEQNGPVMTGKAGNAFCRLIRQRELVDFAVKWMEENR